MTDETRAGTSYVDRVLHEAMLGATSGIDPDRARSVVADTLEALAKMTTALKAAEYQPGDYERIARSMAHAMKSADGLVRLVEFASGRSDSRPDGGADWLKALTNEQLATVSGWIEAANRGGSPEERPAPKEGRR